MTETQSLPMGRMLVVDDEPSVARVLGTFFTREGWRVQECQSPAAALELPGLQDVDVIITDLCMPELSGTELIRALRERGCEAPVLVITAYGTIDSAVDAMRVGAFDYLTKPFDFEKVNASVRRAYLERQLRRERASLSGDAEERYRFAGLIGSSPRMQEVYALVERAARSHATVLILGESGTGKELVARALHSGCARSNKRFVAVSCAALPAELLESELFGHEKGAFTGANWQRIGRFELADGGTLFMDEIGDISLAVQAKLLRAVQEREIDRVGGAKPVKVDVRLVTATNRNLREAVAKNEFREDLYYRLRVLEIRLPALRERKEDIPLLAGHFLQKYAKRDGRKLDGFTDEALDLLDRYDWPGNVRELENVVERALVLVEEDTRQVTAEMLPRELQAQRRPSAQPTPSAPGEGVTLPAALEALERAMVLAALNRCDWDLERTAEDLGVSVRSASYIIQKLDLIRGDRPAFSGLG
ncbi:MAG: sigma-54-dependent transcriptional regulator [Actinomycetota bacterium]